MGRVGAIAAIGFVVACGDIREVPVVVDADGSSTGSGSTSAATIVQDSGAPVTASTTDADTGSESTTQGATSTGVVDDGRISICAEGSSSIDPATGQMELALDVEDLRTAVDVDVLVRIYHEEVGQVDVELVRDAGSSVVLFPWLERDDCTPDLSVRFDDDGELDADEACEADTTDGSRLTVRPQDDLASLLRGGVADHWRVIVTDHRRAPAGEMITFCLSFAER